MKLVRYHGWLLLAHPHFEDQYSRWFNEVKRLAKAKPETYKTHEKTKRLAALDKLVFETIPQDPTHQRFLLGNSLGESNKAWRRAKLGSQYRVFFRFDSKAQILVFAWVNDQDSLRAYGSKSDAYLVFASRLRNDDPPSNWDELLEQSVGETAKQPKSKGGSG